MPKNYKRKYAKVQTPIVLELKAARQRQNLRADVLSEMIGQYPQAVERWERGYKFPSFFALNNWCNALDRELGSNERA